MKHLCVLRLLYTHVNEIDLHKSCVPILEYSMEKLRHMYQYDLVRQEAV